MNPFSLNKNKLSAQSPDTVGKRRNTITRLWCIFLGLTLAVLAFFALIYNGVIGYMPDIEDLKNPTDKYASIIYTADGKEMGRYFRNSGNRLAADYDEISDHVVNALVATEDSRFFDHSGIDFRALMRVVFKTMLLRQKNAGGGSTITQQLAKQLYSPESSGAVSRMLQKPIEWMIAVKLERFYSKDEILKMYLNQFDFLYNAVGIRSAAQVYFNKQPDQLNIQEAAMLVGMVKNPAIYNPIRHPERTLQRRNVVFDQMVKAGMLTSAEADSLKLLPLGVDLHRVDHKEGIAPYVREQIRYMLRAKKPERANYRGWEQDKFVTDSTEWVRNPLYGWIEKNPKPDGSKYDIYTDGLKIHTTIDSRMQAYAEDAVKQHMGQTLQPAFFREKRASATAPYSSNANEISQIRVRHLINNAIKQTDRWRTLKKAGMADAEIRRTFDIPTGMKVFSYSGAIDTVMTPLDSLLYHKHFLRMGFVAMDPASGHIKAYVGGPDFNFFKYDMVSTGRRQIGSTVKPFLYTYAMEEGYTPCDQLLNAQPVLWEDGRKWMPRSGRARAGQMVDLRWALTTSNNWISARLIDQLSPGALVRTMRNFGITTPMEPHLSLALGPMDVSVLEMVGAYSAFANRGMRVDPLLVTSITDNNGNTIAEFTPHHTEVISEKAYYRILSMLQNVIDNGTGRRLRSAPYNLSVDMGGKTGTTNYSADGWFMGFTPELVAGAWVGGEERFIHFNNGSIGQGAQMALPIYGLFMRKVYSDPKLGYKQDARFVFPTNMRLCENDFIGSYSGGDGITESWSSSADDAEANEASEAAASTDDQFFD